MRMTTAMMANRSVYAINNSNRLMNKYQTQLETQTKISRPSDDPVVAMKGVKNRTELSGINQYIRNNTEANAWIEATDTAYDEAKSLIQRMRELADGLANGTNTEKDRQTAAEELKQIKDHMVDIANTQIAGKYIFNGTDIDIRPFTVAANGKITPPNGVGTKDPIRVEVSRADGSDVMMEVNSFPNMFFVPNNSAGATGTTQIGNKVVAENTEIKITIDGKDTSVALYAGDDLKKMMVRINEAFVKQGGEPIATVEEKTDPQTGADTSELKFTTYTDDPNGSVLDVDFNGLQLAASPMKVENDPNVAGGTSVTVDQKVLSAGKMTVTDDKGKSYTIDLEKNDDINAIQTKLQNAVGGAGGGNLPSGIKINNNKISIAAGAKIEFSKTIYTGAGGPPTCTSKQEAYDPNDPNKPGLKKPSVFDEMDSFISLLDNARGLSETDVSIELSNWLVTADQMLERANLAMAEVGGKQNRLDLVSSRNKDTHIFVNKMLSENEDIDIEEVIINLSMQETMHRASLAVSAKIIQPSLIDFLR